MKHEYLNPPSDPSGSIATVPSPQDIERRARTLWEEDGRPEGRALEHWLAAERELRLVQGFKPAKNGKDEPAGNPAYPPLAEREKIVAARTGRTERVEKLPASKLAAGAKTGAKTEAGSPELPAATKRTAYASRRGATRG